MLDKPRIPAYNNAQDKKTDE